MTHFSTVSTSESHRLKQYYEKQDLPIETEANLVKKTKPLNSLGHFVNGVLANGIMCCIMQPGFTWKTYVMSGKGFPPANRLYNGLGVNILSGGPGEGVAFFTHSFVSSFFKQKHQTLTEVDNLMASIAAGAAGALVISPCERGMILQQLKGGSLS